MAEAATDTRLLERKEAAAYLTSRWFRISHRTLADMASADKGPTYVVTEPSGGRALYSKADLDTWAQQRLQPPPKRQPPSPPTIGALAPISRR
jgi:hypothetical protein